MLDKRKSAILKEVVYRYITTGTPVSSNAVARALNIGISPATIRNEMSRLEEMGYLYHPHTSAGKIPTHQGYRFYVDSLMGRARLRKEEKEAIQTLFSNQAKELENLMQETSELLSRLTQALSLVVSPRLRRSTLKHLDLLSMHDRLILMVIITNTGRVEKKVLEMNTSLSDEELIKIQNWLNHNLNGQSLSEIDVSAAQKLKAPRKIREAAKSIIKEIKDLLVRDEYEGVYVGGKANLIRLKEPETFRRIEALLEALEQQYFILNVVNELLVENQLLIKIGNENPSEELQDFSLVATPYAIGEQQMGSVGVIGPMRMDYARIIPMVDLVAKSLSKSLEILRG